MKIVMKIVVVAALASLVAGCAGAGTRTGGPGAANASVVGDEKGGTITDGVANSQGAYGAATNHCKTYNRRAFITKWDPPNNRGAIVFECR